MGKSTQDLIRTTLPHRVAAFSRGAGVIVKQMLVWSSPLFLIACSTSVSPEEEVALVNAGTCLVFYFVVGLRTSFRLDPRPIILLGESRLPMLAGGSFRNVGSKKSFEAEGGITVFVYRPRVGPTGSADSLVLIADVQVAYADLKDHVTINIE